MDLALSGWTSGVKLTVSDHFIVINYLSMLANVPGIIHLHKEPVQVGTSDIY